MADSKLTLPGLFEAGKRYLLEGATLLAWKKALLADRVVAGDGITESQTPNGRIFKAAGGAGGSGIPPAFFRTYVSESKWYLQGGQVTGSAGNVGVADIDLGTTVVGEEVTQPDDGTIYWLEITGDGELEEGILYGGFDITGVAAGDGATLPDNTVPTVESDTGRKFHFMLGMWQGGIFHASNGGHLNLNFCPGTGYNPTRF